VRHGRARRGGNRRRAPRGDTALLGHGVASLTRRARREARKPAARTRAVCCSSPSPFGAKPCQRRPVTSFAPRFSTFRHSVSGNRARLPDSPPALAGELFRPGEGTASLSRSRLGTPPGAPHARLGALASRARPSARLRRLGRPRRARGLTDPRRRRITRRESGGGTTRPQAAVAFRGSSESGERSHGGLEEEGRVRQARHGLRQG
jgi:hypothetical protein